MPVSFHAGVVPTSCKRGSCPKQRSTNPKPLQRTACLHSDYVFTGIVVDIEDQNSMQKIAFRVVDVYKTYSNGLKKDIEVYMYKLTNCDYPEIKSGEQYLIMVKKSEVYVMNEDTYVLEWPGSVRKARKVKNALNQVRQGAVCDEMTA
eukprot:gene10957-19792_t